MNKNTTTLLSAIAILGLVGGGIYWFQSNPRKAESQQQQESAPVQTGGFNRSLAKGPLAAFLVHAERKPIAAFAFADATGAPLKLDNWKGRVVLLNLWATWCAPCRKEMPDLAKLEADLGSADFEVVALSVDRKGAPASAAFLSETGAGNLKTYIDPEAKSLAALQALGLPATILIDRNGLEAGRLLGPAVWSSPEAVALIKALLDEKP